MRHMSFAMTKSSFLDGSKTVTRRVGWANLKPGDLLLGVEKCQGLKKGERVKPLGEIRVKSVRREPLSFIRAEPDGTKREGLPHLSAHEFVEHFCKAMRVTPDTLVTRIEFEHYDPDEDAGCDECAAPPAEPCRPDCYTRGAS